MLFHLLNPHDMYNYGVCEVLSLASYKDSRILFFKSRILFCKLPKCHSIVTPAVKVFVISDAICIGPRTSFGMIELD